MHSDKAVGHRIRTLSNLIKRNMDGFYAKRGMDELTGARGWAIGYLCHHGDRDIYQRDLEKELSVRRSTITNLLTLMENNGLIRREAVEGDRRLKKIVVTEKARRLHDEFERELDGLEDKIKRGISEQELAAFMATAEKIRNNLENTEEIC